MCHFCKSHDAVVKNQYKWHVVNIQVWCPCKGSGGELAPFRFPWAISHLLNAFTSTGMHPSGNRQDERRGAASYNEKLKNDMLYVWRIYDLPVQDNPFPVSEE